jgi:hypothetical protein
MKQLNQAQPIFYKGKKCDFIFWDCLIVTDNKMLRVMIGKRIKMVLLTDLTN